MRTVPRTVPYIMQRGYKDISSGRPPHKKATGDSSDWDFGSRGLGAGQGAVTLQQYSTPPDASKIDIFNFRDRYLHPSPPLRPNLWIINHCVV
jgi:hypothetical protein